MNKVLHVLVYVFLVLAGAALYFELELNDKRSELTDRNRMQENYLVKIAKTIEKTEPETASFEIMKDNSPVEAKLVDDPDMENVLDDYPAPLEQTTGLETYNWDGQGVRQQLRTVYALDPEGKPIKDGNEFLKSGPGTEDELLGKLFESAKAQQSRLNTTRAALTELRGKLESVVGELNKVKPDARQAKVQVEELKEKAEKLEGEKAELEAQLTKYKSRVQEAEDRIGVLNNEINEERDKVAAAQEDCEKLKKDCLRLQEQLNKASFAGGAKVTGGGVAVSTLPAGDKGKLVEVDNENMFAIIEFSAEAMKELKGDDGNGVMPAIELGIRRPGFEGDAGEFIGRVLLRQEVKGKNFVICDILSSWEQTKAEIGDVIFAD